jgi:HAE1 family hydrophobic/amphiphilic exporter-1
MFHFLKWILKHPVSVLLCVLVFTLVGIVSLVHIPIEIKPDQSSQGIQIVAHWGKHPPETIQRLITHPLEEVAMRVKEVSAVESSTGIGNAVIQLNFPKRTDLKYVYIDLRERLASIKDKIPEDARLQVEPLFKNDEAEKAFSSSFFDIELIGPLPLDDLRFLAKEKVLPQLNGVDGIGKLELYGGSDGYVQILLDDQKMEILNIEPDHVYNRLQAWSVNKGLGTVKQSGANFLLSLDSRPKTIHDLNNIPIRNGVNLGEIGKISFSYEPPQRLSRHDFKPLVLIQVFKTQGVNALVFSNALKEKINEIQSSLPSGVTLRIASDSSQELRDELKSLGVRASVILGVVFAILFFLFRRWIHSTIILFVVLLSFTGSAIFLYLSGYTINVVTLAGIALVFGMLVDNAIVVVENIQRIRSQGKSPFYSGMRGTLEVTQPLLASTATTVFVFFALLLLEDRLGTYYKPLAYVLGFSLIMSLVIALVLIPAIFIRWPKMMTVAKQSRWTKKSLGWYASLLTALIAWRKTTIFVVLLVFASVSYVFWNYIEKGGFFTWGDKEKLSVYVDAPKGVALEVLDEITRNFERVIQNQNVQCETQTIVDEPGGYGYIKISFPDSIVNSIKPFVLKEYLISEAVNYAGVGIGIYGFGMPYWNGGYKVRTLYNTSLQITGPDYYRLWEIGENILELAKADPRVNEGIISPSARSLYQSDLKEIAFEGKTEKIWQSRLSLASVMNAARHLFLNQSWQSETVINERRYPLKVRYGEKLPEYESLKNGYLHINRDRKIPVSEHFRVKKEPIQPWIDKKNQQYKFTVAWQYRGPERMRSRHEKSIVQSLRLPPGYRLEEKHWGFLTQKEESDLIKILFIIGVGTFMILAALYESFSKPFIIFFTVPFALVGVFLFYILFERDFNVNGYIGLILLLGIVLNNGIVLVERINQLIQRGLSTIDAAVQGGIERIRPIMITTLTTVGGLIPLVFLPTGNTTMAKILEELSFITIGGLISSTLFAITLVPLIYCLVEELNRRITIGSVKN